MSPQQAAARGEGHLWKGNDRADRLANEARANLADRAKAYIDECRIRTGILHRVADVLAEAMPALHTLAKAPKQEGSQRVRSQGRHEWIWRRTRWLCLTCGREAKLKTVDIMRSPCLGLPAFADADASHRLYRWFIGHLPIVFCRECGAYTTSRKGKLLQQRRPCRTTIVTRLRRGVHPATKVAMHSVQPLGAIVRCTNGLLSSVASAKGVPPDTLPSPRPSQLDVAWDEGDIAAAAHALECADIEAEWQADFAAACEIGIHGGL
jgi:hypothetical protein